jgi:drug/metabolite transporter (DMT)-like permease
MIVAQWMGVLAKLALFEVAAFRFVWLQVLSASAFMLIYTFVFRREGWPQGLEAREWLAVALIGVVNFGIVRFCMLLSLERLPATTHVFLMSFVGLATMSMSILFLAERPSRLQVLGAVVAILGVRLFFPDLPPPRELLGVAYLAVVVLGLALANNVTRWLVMRAGERISSTQLAAISMLFGGMPLVLSGLALDPSLDVGGLRNGLIIFANGVIGIALVQTVLNAIFRTLRSYEVSILAGSGVIWTALLAVPILGERLSGQQIAAIAVLLSGLFLAQLRQGDLRGAQIPVAGPSGASSNRCDESAERRVEG